MNEYLMIVYMALSGTLFALGGTLHKAFRRFGVPLVTAGFLYLNHVPTIQIIFAAALPVVFFHLGYGEGKGWVERALVGVLYGAATLVVGVSYWALAIPFIFITLFTLSNTQETEKYFPWKIVEFLTGVVIAIGYITAVGN